MMDFQNDTEAERDVRMMFSRWLEESSTKDLDLAMSRIATDVVSYEHEAPLEYRGVEALRQTCAAGFEVMAGEFEWDVPDLQVVVRDDIAVTWGINHMRAVTPEGDVVENRSRGTRIFRRIDGEWMMIHQHVSYPYEPSTGNAVTDLAPTAS